MGFCTRCGHELGVGRFCTNCGHPIETGAPPVDDWRTDTAERPAVPPLKPVGLHRDRYRWLPWAVSAAAFVLVVVLAIVLLTGEDKDDTESAADPGTTSTPSESATAAASGSPPPTPPAEPEDVARFATAIVPATAPPNLDLDGNQVRYEARNMLDGVAETCWRMPGDGNGSEITLQLAEPTTLTSVGLINGYAKTATDAGGGRLDWYDGNRRIQAVEWVFDDGTVLAQDLTETRRVQTIPVDEITTSTIRLRLLSVSAPGTGRATRDYTAISDVSIVGVS